MDHDTFREWLDLEVDGALGDAERARLETHLVSCPECREESRTLALLKVRLTASRVPVREGFAAAVMDALEPAAWESRSPRAWAWPLALALALAGGAAGLTAMAARELDTAGPWWSALGAVADLFRAALVAGSGLAAATWTGVSAAVAEWLGRSPANWVAAGVLVVGLNLLGLRLIRAGGAAVRRPAPPPR
jgi:anti-sigma factor RsiW